MAQKKSADVDAWLARPDAGVIVVLVYGPDHGLVAERARRFAGALGLPLDDPFCVVRFDAAELDQQPGRLLDEVQTVPMFASRRLLWIRNAGSQKSISDALRLMADQLPRDAIVLIEAGDLKKSAALRTTVESSTIGMALPCYADDERAIDRLIDEVLGRDGLGIAGDARAALRRNLGGDRLASRGEVEKLALYALGAGEVTLAHVHAVDGNASALSVDDAVDAVMAGKPENFDAIYSRQCQNASHAFQFLSAAMRQFQVLRSLRAQIDDGKTAAGAVAGARPPVFYTRRSLVERVIAKVPASDLEDMLRRLYDCVLLTRREPALAVASTRQAFLAIAVRLARA